MSDDLLHTLRNAALVPPAEVLLLRDRAADRIEALEAELAAERAKTRTERDLRRRYGIAYAKKVQQLHEAAEDHAQSLAALTEARAEVYFWRNRYDEALGDG